jgi:HAD superfamily hydrolase (TIGR01509 family)
VINVILIDIGNVLVDFDIRRLLAEAAERSGKTQQEALMLLLKTGVFEKYEKGLISTPQFFEEIKQGLGFLGPFEHFRDSWNAIFKENADGAAAFHALKKTQHVLLASNTNEMHFEHLERQFPFLKEAHGSVLSHKIHARKPELDFYRKALARAAVPAAEALLIDDLLENVEGARKAGMQAVQFKDLASLREALAAHGVAI